MTKTQKPRKRCVVCRRYFGFMILEDLYCSWKCQGWSDEEIEEAWARARISWARRQARRSERNIPAGVEVPRECRTWYYKYKDRLSEHKARQRAATLGGDTTAYQCSNCGHWHVGRLHEKENEDAGHVDGEGGGLQRPADALPQ